VSYFNKNIRYYRKMRRLTQDAFAVFLGIKKGKLIAWENKSEPKFDELVRICDQLKVNLSDFISQEINDNNVSEFFTDNNMSIDKFDEPLLVYGPGKTTFENENIEELDLFSIINRLVYVSDPSARRELADTLKTEFGRILLDLARQKDKNIRLLERYSIEKNHKYFSDKEGGDKESENTTTSE